jgi:hypothetical protein
MCQKKEVREKARNLSFPDFALAFRPKSETYSLLVWQKEDTLRSAQYYPSVGTEMGFPPFPLDQKTVYSDLLKLGDSIIRGTFQFLPRRFHPCLKILPGMSPDFF